MKRISLRGVLPVFITLLFYNSVQAQEYLCDIEDVGTLTLHESIAKISLTHVWQGAWGGVRTNNADRITGLYDFDLYYLLSAKQAANQDGDYTLLVCSVQSSFGKGLKDSKLSSFFELNDAAKGYNEVLIDKLFVQFTTLNRALTVDIGKIEIKDLFDGSAVAHCEKSQFIAEPLVHNLAVPWPGHGLGARVLLKPTNSWYAQAAIGDAQAVKRETGLRTAFHDEDYFFGIAEIGIKPNLADLHGTYRFMLWYDPQNKSYLDGSAKVNRDDLGMAVSIDQQVNDRATVFFRYGWADDKVNELEDFVSFGGQIEGLIEGRNEDIFAVGYVRGLRSPHGLPARGERQIDLIETYYKIKVNDNLLISPIVQFEMDPGGVKNESPAIVFGIRCRLKF